MKWLRILLIDMPPTLELREIQGLKREDSVGLPIVVKDSAAVSGVQWTKVRLVRYSSHVLLE